MNNTEFFKSKLQIIKSLLKKKWQFVVAIILFIGIFAVGIVHKKAQNDKYHVMIEHVKAFKLITHTVRYSNVHVDSTDKKIKIKEAKAKVRLSYNLENITIKGDSLILPSCEILPFRSPSDLGGYIVSNGSQKDIEDVYRDENRLIIEQMRNRGYVNLSYKNVESLLRDFLNKCDCKGLKIYPSSDDARIMREYEAETARLAAEAKAKVY